MNLLSVRGPAAVCRQAARRSDGSSSALSCGAVRWLPIWASSQAVAGAVAPLLLRVIVGEPFVLRYYKFESIPLQRRGNKLSFPLAISVRRLRYRKRPPGRV